MRSVSISSLTIFFALTSISTGCAQLTKAQTKLSSATATPTGPTASNDSTSEQVAPPNSNSVTTASSESRAMPSSKPAHARSAATAPIAETPYFDWPRFNTDKQSLASLSGFDQGVYLAEALRFRRSTEQGAWLLDTMPRPSATQRLVQAYYCVKQAQDTHRSFSPHDAILWAACAIDTKALDATAFAKEVDSSTLDPDDKAKVKAHHAWVEAKVAEVEKQMSERSTADVGFKTLLQTLPAKVQTDWTSEAKAMPQLPTLRAAIDASRAQSRKSIEACETSVLPLLEKVVKSGKVETKTNDLLRELAAVDPVLMLAMHTCFQVPAGNALRRTPAIGPRTAMLKMLMDQAASVQFDDMSIKPGAYVFAFEKWPEPHMIGGGGFNSNGIIENVATTDQSVTITFAASAFEVNTCVEERDTNIVDGIDANGKFIYRKVCNKWGTKKINNTPEPVTFAKRFAAELAPGRMLNYVYANVNGMQGMPLEVHSGKDIKSPVVARFGVKL